MADEKKKPWQFSLAQAMGAMTAICVTMAIVGALFSLGITEIGLVAVLMGFGSAVGAVIGGIEGAAFGAMLGFVCLVGLRFLLFLAGEIIF